MGKHKHPCDNLRSCHLLTAVYGYYDIIFQIAHKKILIFTPKLPSAALILRKAETADHFFLISLTEGMTRNPFMSHHAFVIQRQYTVLAKKKYFFVLYSIMSTK